MRRLSAAPVRIAVRAGAAHAQITLYLYDSAAAATPARRALLAAAGAPASAAAAAHPGRSATV